MTPPHGDTSGDSCERRVAAQGGPHCEKLMIRVAPIAVAMTVSFACQSTLAAQQEAVRPEVLPRSEEMEIALSAAPAHLRDQATVWVLEDSGYVVAREGSNGFACIINRDHPMNRKPTCYDAEGAATILPKVLYVGKLMMRVSSRGRLHPRFGPPPIALPPK